jgi:hypothetical protein
MTALTLDTQRGPAPAVAPTPVAGAVPGCLTSPDAHRGFVTCEDTLSHIGLGYVALFLRI